MIVFVFRFVYLISLVNARVCCCRHPSAEVASFSSREPYDPAQTRLRQASEK